MAALLIFGVLIFDPLSDHLLNHLFSILMKSWSTFHSSLSWHVYHIPDTHDDTFGHPWPLKRAYTFRPNKWVIMTHLFDQDQAQCNHLMITAAELLWQSIRWRLILIHMTYDSLHFQDRHNSRASLPVPKLSLVVSLVRVSAEADKCPQSWCLSLWHDSVMRCPLIDWVPMFRERGGVVLMIGGPRMAMLITPMMRLLESVTGVTLVGSGMGSMFAPDFHGGSWCGMHDFFDVYSFVPSPARCTATHSWVTVMTCGFTAWGFVLPRGRSMHPPQDRTSICLMIRWCSCRWQPTAKLRVRACLAVRSTSPDSLPST